MALEKDVKYKKQETGTVIRKKTDKTIVVELSGMMKHPVYGKYMRVVKKFMAHDEDNKAKVGDKVVIEQSRPISKMKSWVLVEISEVSK